MAVDLLKSLQLHYLPVISTEALWSIRNQSAAQAKSWEWSQLLPTWPASLTILLMLAPEWRAETPPTDLLSAPATQATPPSHKLLSLLSTLTRPHHPRSSSFPRSSYDLQTQNSTLSNPSQPSVELRSILNVLSSQHLDSTHSSNPAFPSCPLSLAPMLLWCPHGWSIPTSGRSPGPNLVPGVYGMGSWNRLKE